MECSLNGRVPEARDGKSHADGGWNEKGTRKLLYRRIGKDDVGLGPGLRTGLWARHAWPCSGMGLGRIRTFRTSILGKTWRDESKTKFKRRAALAQLHKCVKV